MLKAVNKKKATNPKNKTNSVSSNYNLRSKSRHGILDSGSNSNCDDKNLEESIEKKIEMVKNKQSNAMNALRSNEHETIENNSKISIELNHFEINNLTPPSTNSNNQNETDNEEIVFKYENVDL